MSKKIQINKTGGTEVMEWVDNSLSKTGPGRKEVRIKHSAIGVNFIDTYHRSGVYPAPLPCVLGIEAAGVIDSVGAEVDGFNRGDRVGYAAGPLGAYCETRDYPMKNIVKIPDFINDFQAASVLLKGMTVEYLFNRTYHLKKDEYFLFHAAAGGVGLLASQWSKHIGSKMIGTVSTEKKEFLAKKAGCDFIINYKKDDVAKRIMEITGGAGVSVVYDGVGKDTFRSSLDSLSDRGLFVSFGQSSGMIEAVNLHEIFAPKNLFYTRPSLLVYNKNRSDLIKSANSVFGLIKTKKIKMDNIKKYNLKDAARAHEDLQTRKTVGSLVLVP